MNALQLRETGRKKRRGLQGVVRSGRHTGGRVYGYKIRREIDAIGDPIRGLRDIDPDEAEVVIEIFRRYAAGQSPRAIVSDLNRRGIPGPRGGSWNASTINGNAERGNWVIHNELYCGVLVFGRQTWVKDRRTGKPQARTADPQEILRTEVPNLRIISEALWAKVQDRYAENTLSPRTSSPRGAVRPRYLLSGKLTCGVCGGPCALIAHDRKRTPQSPDWLRRPPRQADTRRLSHHGPRHRSRSRRLPDADRGRRHAKRRDLVAFQ